MKLQKWGNSAGVRFPQELLRQLGMHIGDELETEIQNGALIIRARKRPHYRLADLLAEGGCERVSGWEEMADAGNAVVE